MNNADAVVVYLERAELSSLEALFALMAPDSDQPGITQRFAFMAGPARQLRHQLLSALDHPDAQSVQGEIRVDLSLSGDDIEIISHFIRKVRLSELIAAIQDEERATEASLGLWKLADAARPITLEF